MFAAACCFADIAREFSPSAKCGGDGAIRLDRSYKLDAVRGATFIFTGRYDQ